MSRPSSRQNPDGLATPRRDGLMSDEQEALLRSSLSLTSLSASTNRPLSPIAIRTLLQEAYKKPSTPMADDPVELGAWNAVTPRNHLPTSNQPTPQRLQASSSFQKPPLPSGGGSSSFSRPPAPASHHSMHTYPNQHRPANLYRNFIIDDADQSSPSSPKVASGHSSKNFGGAGAIRTTSAVSGAPTSDTPGKRKHSLVHSMSFTNTPSGVLHVPSYASGVEMLDVSPLTPGETADLPPLPLPSPPQPSLVASPSPPPSRPLSIASKVAESASISEWPEPRPRPTPQFFPLPPPLLSYSPPPSAPINTKLKSHILESSTRLYQGEGRPYAFKAKPWWEREGRSIKPSSSHAPQPLNAPLTTSTLPSSSSPPIILTSLPLPLTTLHSSSLPASATAPVTQQLEDLSLFTPRLSPPVPPPSRQSRDAARLYHLNTDQLPLIPPTSPDTKSSAPHTLSILEASEGAGGLGPMQESWGFAPPTNDQVQELMGLNSRQGSPERSSHALANSLDLPPRATLSHPHASSSMRDPAAESAAFSASYSDYYFSNLSQHTVGSLAVRLADVAKRSQDHIDLVKNPSKANSSGSPVNNNHTNKGSKGKGKGKFRPCPQTTADWELLLEKNRSRMMAMVDDLAPLLRPQPTSPSRPKPPPPPPLPSYAMPLGQPRYWSSKQYQLNPIPSPSKPGVIPPLGLSFSGGAADSNAGGAWSSSALGSDSEAAGITTVLTDRSNGSNYPEVEIFRLNSPLDTVKEKLGDESNELETDMEDENQEAIKEEEEEENVVEEKEAEEELKEMKSNEAESVPRIEPPPRFSSDEDHVASYPAPSWMLEGGLAPLRPPPSPTSIDGLLGGLSSPPLHHRPSSSSAAATVATAALEGDVKVSWSSIKKDSKNESANGNISEMSSEAPKSIVPPASDENTQAGSDNLLYMRVGEAEATNELQDMQDVSIGNNAMEEENGGKILQSPYLTASSPSSPSPPSPRIRQEASLISLIDPTVSEDPKMVESEHLSVNESDLNTHSPPSLTTPPAPADIIQQPATKDPLQISSGLAQATEATGEDADDASANQESNEQMSKDLQDHPLDQMSADLQQTAMTGSGAQGGAQGVSSSSQPLDADLPPSDVSTLSQLSLSYQHAPVVTSGVDFVVTKTLQPPWRPEPTELTVEKERQEQLDKLDRQLMEEAARLKAGAKALKAMGGVGELSGSGGGGGGGGRGEGSGGQEGVTLIREINHAPRGSSHQLQASPAPAPAPTPAPAPRPVSSKAPHHRHQSAKVLNKDSGDKGDANDAQVETATGGKAVTQDIWA